MPERKLKTSTPRYTARMSSFGESLAHFLERAGRVVALTGAGVSTASGIPEYRDREGRWKHAQPVQFADFKGSELTRRRYWARSFAGWQRMSSAQPNDAHTALADLETQGFIDTLVTQNVDGLHTTAGHRDVVDLHGRLDTVRCLDCDWREERRDWQRRLEHRNQGWHATVQAINPDGDVELSDDNYGGFNVPECDACGGIVKPDVVFFGESVPRERVERVADAGRRAGALLVAGSSLMVFSGFRFARLAREAGKPIVIVNDGRTRADDIADLKLEGDCGEVLTTAVEQLASASPRQIG